MADLYIDIDQNLVDKTMDTISWDPFVLLDFPSRADRTMPVPLTAQSNDVLRSPISDFRDYAKSALAQAADMAASATVSGDLDPHYLELSKYDAQGHRRLIERELGGLISTAEFGELMEADRKKAQIDAEEFAGDVCALYVLTYQDRFNSDAGIVADAEEIRDRMAGKYTVLGLGRFFRRIARAVVNIFRDITWYMIRQIENVFRLGSPKLEQLKATVRGRPRVRLGNPVSVANANVRVDRVRVVIPFQWRFPGTGWNDREVSFSAADLIEVGADGQFAVSNHGEDGVETLKIWVAPSFSKLDFRLNILGVWFSISVCSLANRLLSPIAVFDASKLVAPLQLIRVKFELSNLRISDAGRGIRVLVETKASPIFS